MILCGGHPVQVQIPSSNDAYVLGMRVEPVGAKEFYVLAHSLQAKNRFDQRLAAASIRRWLFKMSIGKHWGLGS